MIYLLAPLVVLLILAGCKEDREIGTPGKLVPKTVDKDPSLPSIIVNSTMLHSEAYGNPDSAMIVMLHGGPGGDYRSLLAAKQLANDGYYVVFYDQRGSGLSKRHNKGSYTIQLLLDDLTGVIAHYRTSPTQKVFLFGHSWGAMLAAAYINEYPDRISGVILAEPGGLTYENHKEYSKRSRKLNLTAETTNNVLYVDQFMTGKENDHEILDYKIALGRAFVSGTGSSEGIEGFAPYWRDGAVILYSLAELADKDGFNFTTNLSKFKTKAIMMYGENNTAFGLELAQKEAGYFPNCEIVKIADTGHEMIYFKWADVYPVALSYFNSLK